MTKKTPKIDKLYKALLSGKNVPVATLERKSGLANISAAVNTLRQEGAVIIVNRVGKKNAYRLVA